MHDAVTMGGGQRVQHGVQDGQGLPRGQYAAFIQHVAQRPTTQVFHRQIQQVPVRPLVVDLHDVRMGQPGRCAGLSNEPGGELVVVREVGVHHLDGDVPIQAPVQRLVDGRHPSAGYSRPDQIPTVELAPDERVLQGRVHSRSVRASLDPGW